MRVRWIKNVHTLSSSFITFLSSSHIKPTCTTDKIVTSLASSPNCIHIILIPLQALFPRKASQALNEILYYSRLREIYLPYMPTVFLTAICPHGHYLKPAARLISSRKHRKMHYFFLVWGNSLRGDSKLTIINHISIYWLKLKLVFANLGMYV